MSKSMKFNGVDVTNMLTPAGYEVEYVSVQGDNGGRTKDGSYVEDEIAVKAVIKAPFIPLNESDLSALLSVIYSATYVSLYYFDPKANAYKTITARKSVSSQKYRGKGADGKEYWTGTVVTITEK